MLEAMGTDNDLKVAEAGASEDPRGLHARPARQGTLVHRDDEIVERHEDPKGTSRCGLRHAQIEGSHLAQGAQDERVRIEGSRFTRKRKL